MTTLADRTIAALRSTHDTLATLVPDLTDDQLTGPSGSAGWTVADVLSHLGSGAEIGFATLRAGLGAPAPAEGFNQGVWDRWNAMSPREQATGFLDRDEHLVAAFEALTAEQRQQLHVELGFLPAPVPVGSLAGMRLDEAALHTWDVLVAGDPAATLDGDTAEVIAEHLTGGLSFMIGFIGKAERLATPAVVTVEGSDFGITVADKVSVTAGVTDPTATFVGPLESAVRLVFGRLTPEHTPNGVDVTGALTLDQLRTVFPGF